MFRMSRTDRRPWREARTVADLGELTALWLENRLGWCPGGYGTYGDGRPDPETVPLIPTLATLNRGGFLTTGSQPGEAAGRGWDGAQYAQRAAVDGHVADRQLLDRITRAARKADLLVGIDGDPIIVTTRNGKPVTAFGGRMSRREMRVVWDGVSRTALDAITTSTHLTIADPEWGPHTRLWDALNAATR